MVGRGHIHDCVRIPEHGFETYVELSAARERLARLKFHPREALPNVTALARADALYAELVGADRTRLGAGIVAFRAALEAQNQALIPAQRDALLHLMLELAKP